MVVQYVKPWLSEADIEAGERWATEVAEELEASNFGIICVTPENLNAPWILFEAGALAKSMQGTRVIPLLFGLEFSDISGPLTQFQAKKVEEKGMREVVHSINSAAESPISAEMERNLFNALWPNFESRLAAIPTEAPSEKHMRPQHEIMEELVAGVRGLDTRFRELEDAVQEQRERSHLRRFRRFHPRMLDELAHGFSESSDDPIVLLMLASMVRDDYPWIYELVMDVYRAVQSGDGKRIHESMRRLRHLSKRSMMHEFMPMRSKEDHRILIELPMIIDRFVHSRMLSESRSEEESDSAVDSDGQ